MIHVTLPQLCAFLDDELAEASAELVRRHLSECLECTERFARLEAQEESLVRILSDEPDDAFFQQLCASISLGQPDPVERRVPVLETKPTAKKDAKRKARAKIAPEPRQKPAPERREVSAAPTWDEPIAPPHAEPVVPVEAAPVLPVVEKPAPPVREEHVVGRAERLMREEPAVVRPERPARGTPVPARPVRRSMVRPQRRAEDPSPHALSPRAAAIVAVACCLVAGSIAWVTLRPRDNGPNSAIPSAKVEGATTGETPAKASAPTPEELLDRSAPPAPVKEAEEAPAPQVTESNDSAPEPEQIEVETPDPAPRENNVPTIETPAPVKTEPAIAAAIASPPQSKKKPVPTPKPTPATTPAPPPERLVERATTNFVPVRTVISETVISGTDVAPAAERDAPAPANLSNALTKPDPGAAAMRDAKGASLEAAKSKTPAAFDRSSEAWERAIPLLQNAPEQLATARREWAQARFQAWAAEPSAARREAAISAARQYLLYAPPGPERDQAWTWLGRLKH